MENKVSLIRHRETINRIEPYTPGKPLWELQKEIGLKKEIKLASNENPIGPSAKAVEAIKDHLNGLNRYPDADAAELKMAIAAKLSLNKEQLIVTNGADELISLISETFLDSNNEIIVPSPSFSEYDFGAHLMGAEVVPVSFDKGFQFNVDSILSAVTDRTKIVYICSPNNPTGTYLSKSLLEKLLYSLPSGILVVFDSAYSHYASNKDYTDGLEFVRSGYPIIVLQTFSKIYGLAGIRVGFGAAPESIIQSIVRVKEPFNVNTLAQIAATTAIEDEQHIEKSKKVNIIGKKQLYKALSALGFHFTESMSNFILVHLGKNAKVIYQQLLAKGVIVRYGDIWGLPEHIRISIGSLEENRILINSLKSILYKNVN